MDGRSSTLAHKPDDVLSYFRISSRSVSIWCFNSFSPLSLSWLKIAWAVGESESAIRNWWKWKRIQTMEITLIRGLSGSGKSTLADDIEKKIKVGTMSNLSMSHTQWVIQKKRVKVQKISADFYFTDQNGNYNWDGKKLKVSWKGRRFRICNTVLFKVYIFIK